MSTQVREFLTFQRMVTPLVIQVVFWVAAGSAVLVGMVGAVSSIVSMANGSIAAGLGWLIINVLWIAFIPLVVRIYCEILIVLFKMLQALHSIERSLSDSKGGVSREPSTSERASG